MNAKVCAPEGKRKSYSILFFSNTTEMDLDFFWIGHFQFIFLDNQSLLKEWPTTKQDCYQSNNTTRQDKYHNSCIYQHQLTVVRANNSEVN